jgi:hypothetical protein
VSLITAQRRKIGKMNIFSPEGVATVAALLVAAIVASVSSHDRRAISAPQPSACLSRPALDLVRGFFLLNRRGYAHRLRDSTVKARDTDETLKKMFLQPTSWLRLTLSHAIHFSAPHSFFARG